MTNNVTSEEINDFWFVETDPKLWFGKNAEFDTLIRQRFSSIYEAAARGVCDDWQKDALACVALCIVLDQFPRNMFRDAPRSFATDAKALTVARQAVDNGLDRAATVEDKHRHFLYTPFMHSEALEEQRMCLALVSERMDNPDVVAYAERHLAIIERFGRFPHRNVILGRADTAEEAEFLRDKNSRF